MAFVSVLPLLQLFLRVYTSHWNDQLSGFCWEWDRVWFTENAQMSKETDKQFSLRKRDVWLASWPAVRLSPDSPRCSSQHQWSDNTHTHTLTSCEFPWTQPVKRRVGDDVPTGTYHLPGTTYHFDFEVAQFLRNAHIGHISADINIESVYTDNA